MPEDGGWHLRLGLEQGAKHTARVRRQWRRLLSVSFATTLCRRGRVRRQWGRRGLLRAISFAASLEHNLVLFVLLEGGADEAPAEVERRASRLTATGSQGASLRRHRRGTAHAQFIEGSRYDLELLRAEEEKGGGRTIGVSDSVLAASVADAHLHTKEGGLQLLRGRLTQSSWPVLLMHAYKNTKQRREGLNYEGVALLRTRGQRC